MGKFKDDFSSPMYMSNDTYAIDGGLPRDEAAHRISEEIGKPVTAEQLEAEEVRFGFAPESVADIDAGTPDDCPKNTHNSGVMQIEKNEDENKRTLLKCLHCGQHGYYPYGRSGQVFSDEYIAPVDKCKPVKMDLHNKIIAATGSA